MKYRTHPGKKLNNYNLYLNLTLIPIDRKNNLRYKSTIYSSMYLEIIMYPISMIDLSFCRSLSM